ncbi:unnamed protein product [Brassica oleracea]
MISLGPLHQYMYKSNMKRYSIFHHVFMICITTMHILLYTHLMFFSYIVGNPDGLEFDRKCVHPLHCTGIHCYCCNNAPEILKYYDTQAACMAHCTNLTSKWLKKL